MSRNFTSHNLSILSTAQILSSAVLVILHNVLLLLLTLLHYVAGYVVIALEWVIFYTPLFLQGVVWVFGSIFSITQYADDVILSLSENLYYAIDSGLDTLASITVRLQTMLPYCAAIPVQVIKILLDWSKLAGTVVMYLLPSGLYTTQTIHHLHIIGDAFYDISSQLAELMSYFGELGSNFLFETLMGFITSAKFITYCLIKALQISCCQILPTMLGTLYSSTMLVLGQVFSLPFLLLQTTSHFLGEFRDELQWTWEEILVPSFQLIPCLFYYLYNYFTQLVTLLFQPLSYAVEFTVLKLHALFLYLMIPGGLVTVLIGVISYWKWYNPTQPHSSPTTPPPLTLQFTPPPPPTLPSTPREELAVALETEREQKLCVICTVNTKCAVLLPCRHCCLCMECSGKVGEGGMCPLCRQKIDQVLQIYL